MTGRRERALVLAPQGRDAAIAAGLLAEAGIETQVVADLAVLVAALEDEAGLVLLTEEAVRTADLQPLAAWVRAQAAWSDLAFVLLTDRGGGPERNPAAAQLSEVLGNVTFLERPFHPTTLVSLARVAVRGRRRQYQSRAQIEALRGAEESLRQLNETLEQRVEVRTAELERAHATVLEQVAERERAEQKLHQAQKMETIGQLTGSVAHDFNNLLMAILANLEMARKRVLNQGEVVRLLDGAVQGAERGAALTRRLLAFARRQDLQIQPVDLVALVQGMGELLRRSVGPQVEVRFALPEAVPAAMADANQVELALLNLAVNARDAMPAGGTLTVALDATVARAGGSLAPGDYLRLAVTDTGTGMDAGTLSRAVEPFFSTKELGKGTGLGLSMIHGLAVQSNGALRLASEPGRGTRAELWLPATVAQPQVQAPPPQPRATATARLRVLVVDDDLLVAMGTVAMLDDLGHEVLEANSGPEALEILRGGQVVDLLVTDQAMPGMTGVQLAQAARALRPGLPVLLATGYAELPEDGSGELPRLAKPFHQRQLAAQIEALLGGAAGGRPVDAAAQA